MMRKTLILIFAAAMAAFADPELASVPDSAHGTFVQRRTLVDVGVTLVSRGEFRFEKGRFFEWKVVKPVPSVFFATPTNWSFTVRGKTTSHSLGVDVSSFSDVFRIKEMRENVKNVEVSPESGFPRKVDILFNNGDKVGIELVQSR